MIILGIKILLTGKLSKGEKAHFRFEKCNGKSKIGGSEALISADRPPPR